MTPNHSGVGRLVVRNAVWLTVFSSATQFISFGATIILARVLGPQVFGLLAIGTFWSSLLGLRAKAGLSAAAIRQPATDGELLGTLYALDLSFALTSLVMGFIAAAVLLRVGYAPEVALVVVVSLFVEFLPALISPLGLMLEKELQLSRLTLVSVVAATVAYGLAIGLALAGAGLWSLLALNLVSTVIGLIGVYWVCRWRLPHVFRMRWRFSRPMAKQLLKQGLPAGLSSVGISAVVNQYDNFLVGTFVSTTMLGFYDRAYRTSQWPNVLLTAALQRVGFLTFAKVQDDLPRLTHAMRLSLWVLTTFGTPVALALSFGAPDLVLLLYGPAWVQSAIFLRFLALYSLISPFISLGSSLAYALGNIRVTVIITIAQIVTILCLATPLTLWFGANGTVTGVGLTILVGFGISCYYIFHRLPLSVGSVFGAPLLAAGVAALATVFLATRLPGWDNMQPIVRLIATTAASAGTYLALLLVLRHAEMLERWRYLTQTFTGQRGS